MKSFFTLLIVLLTVISGTGQVNYMTLFDFEDGVDSAIWRVFANGTTNPQEDINVVKNPLDFDINQSDSVLMMNVTVDAESWVGYYVDLDTLYDLPIFGALEFNDDSYMMSLMVYKEVISPVRIKLERGLTDPGSFTLTVADTNTVENQWELLEYDFSALKGHYMQRLTIFPDSRSKSTRVEPTEVYLDNIGIQDATNTSVKEFEGLEMKLYPNPAENRMAVVYPEMNGVKISNISGQVIRTENFGITHSKVIEVGDLKPGTYFVTALTGKGNFTMPFIKK